MRSVLDFLVHLAAVVIGQMLLTYTAVGEAPMWVRVVIGIPGLFLIAWGLTGRVSRGRA